MIDMAAAKDLFPRKLFNKGLREIHYGRPTGETDKEGRVLLKNFALKPQSANAFSNEEADYLMKLYKTELIDMANVTVESLTDSRVQNQMAEQNRAQETEIAQRLLDARHVKSVKAYEESRGEGFSHSEAVEIAGLPKDFVEPERLAKQKAPAETKEKASGGQE
jgi:hypothetical protein